MSELPRRKNIRLKDYKYGQNGAYFITICTKGRCNLLARTILDAAYGVQYIELTPVGKMVNQYIKNINNVYAFVQVDKYVIMPNHIHMIIIIQDGTPWAASPTATSVLKIINSLKTLTSKQLGETMWQRSYYDHIIRNEREYLEIWDYVDTNPLKWENDDYYI